MVSIGKCRRADSGWLRPNCSVIQSGENLNSNQKKEEDDPMKEIRKIFSKGTNRRAFLKSSAVAAGAATVGAGFLGKELPTFAKWGPEEHSGRLTPVDPALLMFPSTYDI